MNKFVGRRVKILDQSNPCCDISPYGKVVEVLKNNHPRAVEARVPLVACCVMDNCSCSRLHENACNGYPFDPNNRKDPSIHFKWVDAELCFACKSYLNEGKEHLSIEIFNNSDIERGNILFHKTCFLEAAGEEYYSAFFEKV